MGLKLIRVGKSSVASLPFVYKCRDWVVELCLLVWFGSMLLGAYLDWDKTPWWMWLVDFIIVEVAFYRFTRMLPRRCWRSAVYYSLYCAAAFAIGYTIVYFQNPDYFTTSHEWVMGAIIISIFLVAAALSGFMWRRSVKRYRMIWQEREFRNARRKIVL